VGPGQARLRAATSLGALHGLETLRQLVRGAGETAELPVVAIDDRPRFPWRGLLLDAGRHFMPVEVVKRTLDGMAAVKLNVLHWHLTEDQGFRIESRRFPRLAALGSDGLFYTQEQLRQVVAYARERGIRVVPELDMPGHATSWFVGHPELATLPGPYAIERRWGIHDPVMDPTREETYTFLDALLGELAELFPDPYVHVGGDEVTARHWNESSRVRAFLYEHGLRDNEALQAAFNARVVALLAAHGKSAIGWDEVLHDDLPRTTVVQSWRGAAALAESARRGFPALLSHGFYLDHMQTAAYHYAVDPLPESLQLRPEERARVLGGEACMWSEFVTPETVDSRIWPRTAAIAERLWSPAAVRDVEDMVAPRDHERSARRPRPRPSRGLRADAAAPRGRHTERTAAAAGRGGRAGEALPPRSEPQLQAADAARSPGRRGPARERAGARLPFRAGALAR
jgi:hexosaminidase